MIKGGGKERERGGLNLDTSRLHLCYKCNVILMRADCEPIVNEYGCNVHVRAMMVRVNGAIMRERGTNKKKKKEKEKRRKNGATRQISLSF